MIVKMKTLTKLRPNNIIVCTQKILSTQRILGKTEATRPARRPATTNAVRPRPQRQDRQIIFVCSSELAQDGRWEQGVTGGVAWKKFSDPLNLHKI